MQTSIELNSVNTPITEKLLEKLDANSKAEFYDILERIEFVKRLVSSTRQRASDRPRDSKGRIKVDIVNPHILENMEFFTERAKYFQEHGVYTHLYPNKNPNSEYRKFWDEEKRRCIEGYIRESDGEWITGYHYFYLNYSPIEIVEELKEEVINGTLTTTQLEEAVEGGIRSERVQDFPRIWDGDYLFFHYVEQGEAEGKHGSVLKCRGRGYSFKGGSMQARNYFMIRGSKSYSFASEQEYLTRDGILSKSWVNLNFIDNNTPFTQPRDYKDTEMHKRASYKDVDNKTEKGMLSEIIGVTCKNDPNKGRGKRGKLLFFDESGKFPGLQQTWAIARKSVEQGRYVYGYMITAGTGGTRGADFEAAEKFFYSPDGYNIKSLTNVFDKGAVNTRCALFIPEYLNREGCYDKDGNSDVIKALFEILIQRQKVRNNTLDGTALVQEKAEAPITPQEAVLRVEGSIFPVTELKDYLAEISPNMARFVAPHYVGTLIPESDGSMKFVFTNGTTTPIREFPATENKVGAIEVFEVPARVKDNYRYIIGVDPIDSDEVTYSNSLGSVIVFDRWTRRIVAEYTGRLETTNAFFEIVYRLAIYYNATIMYENNKKGLYGYFQMIKKNIGILADTPEFILDKQTLKPRNVVNNTTKGINATTAINAYGRRLQVDWMLENAYEEFDINAEETDEPKLVTNNIHKIRSIGYIKECIAWNADINCDRCLPEGSLIETSNGIAPIEEIKIEDLVLTKSGIYHPVKVLHKNAYNGKFVKFKVMGDFREIECTANHPIFIRRYLQKPSGINWFKLKYNLPQGNYIEASEIALKDYVMLPKRVNLPESTIPADLLYVLGWYLSDGWVSSKTSTVKFYFQYDQYELALDVLKILNYRFNSKYTEVSKRIEHTGRVVNNFKTKKRRVEGVLYRSKDSNMWVVQKTDLELKNFLISNCGTANNKKISKSLYNSSNLLPFIRGFFEGDGHYRAEYRCDGSFRKSLELSSIYKETIFKIRQILLDMGIWNSIRFVDYSKRANSKDQYTITITGDYCNQIVENSKKFKQKFPLEQNKVKILRVLEDDNGFYTPIVKIDNYNKECMVYNISVDTDESYIVNGILTHNCSAMNMVMLYDMALTEYGTKTSKEKSNTLANDKFFNRKYRSRHIMNDN